MRAVHLQFDVDVALFVENKGVIRAEAFPLELFLDERVFVIQFRHGGGKQVGFQIDQHGLQHPFSAEEHQEAFDARHLTGGYPQKGVPAALGRIWTHCFEVFFFVFHVGPVLVVQ